MVVNSSSINDVMPELVPALYLKLYVQGVGVHKLLRSPDQKGAVVVGMPQVLDCLVSGESSMQPSGRTGLGSWLWPSLQHLGELLVAVGSGQVGWRFSRQISLRSHGALVVKQDLAQFTFAKGCCQVKGSPPVILKDISIAVDISFNIFCSR